MTKFFQLHPLAKIVRYSALSTCVHARAIRKADINILIRKIYEIYFSKCIVNKLLLTMHLNVRSFVVDYAFETKIINGKHFKSNGLYFSNKDTG